MKFNEQLKKYRLKNELSQEDLASKLHISRQAISKWESGDSTPDLNTLVAISQILNLSLDTLVLGIEENDSKTKIDSSIFVFDPRKGRYIKRNLNCWDFLAKFWWLIFPLGYFFVYIYNSIH
ncbi:helix-turn-helix domain-containing protein (plasmid) [Clostridium perfringens]|uniref:helix-turn-helix domain-containing protein n=1 Tax=Clostridium perfringens TaxID=1502 RepID=UPI001A2F551F|nr:helix-turn-helix transcriptional regulator [Clostridium perfringens]EGT3620854.1 helix-turn-helix transcriptional regulator [Clostridium perfringens]HAT4129505.1 helix-turn-helix transcriptional regulator [Clostridium perfringens]